MKGCSFLMSNLSELIIDDYSYFSEIKKYPNVIIYGAGNKARLTLPLLEEKGITPAVVCDKNSDLWGTSLLKKYPICSYEHAISLFSDYCIVICATVNTSLQILSELRHKGEKKPIFHCCNLFKIDTCFLTKSFYSSNLERYEKVYKIFEDDLSKKVYLEFLNSKITGNLFSLVKLTDGNTFFDPQLLGECCPEDVYVDVGAYTGDTLCRFIAYSGLRYKKAIVFEADGGNFSALTNFVQYGVVPNTELINCALWSEKTEKNFYTLENNSNLHSGYANLFNKFSDLADNASLFMSQKEAAGDMSQKVQTSTLDISLSDESPTILKVNALAADLPILKGSIEIIKRCVPDIILEYGVRPDYILEEVEFLHQLNLGYRFYLRQKNIFGDNKTVLYALGGSRDIFRHKT